MPSLPLPIWQERVKNELEVLRNMGALIDSTVVDLGEAMQFVINVRAKGLVKDSNNQLVPQLDHQIQIEINRDFPYPGGIKFLWRSPIFHPNIDPYETGYICLNVLKKWSQLSDLSTTVKALSMLITHPNPEDPLNYPTCLEAAKYFFENPPSEESNDDDILVID
nr:ubiquitin-conjugating enzyme E2 [Candidatus Sigynarchaeota archaeon]